MEVENFGSNNFEDYKRQIDHGGKFVYYQYCVSFIMFTYRVNSKVYLVRGHESGFSLAARYSLVSLLAGWWAIPWGPVYTIQSLVTNLKGGTDVTFEVMEYKNKMLNPRNEYF
jgi:hypothetical protein